MTGITVVIPVKDDGALLDLCLTLLERQTRRADQVIVVDNGSSDDSAQVALRHGAIVLCQPEPGIGAAATLGYDAASGGIIARCDADSRPPADWLERIVAVLDAQPEAIAITGPGTFYDLPAVVRPIVDLLYMRAYFALVRAAIANQPVFGSNFAMTAVAWRRISGNVHRHDAEIHDDLDLSYHLAPESTIVLDTGLHMGISGRPFRDPAGMVVRTRRAGRTILIHGLRESPALRWSRRALRRRRARRHDLDGRVRFSHEVP